MSVNEHGNEAMQIQEPKNNIHARGQGSNPSSTQKKKNLVGQFFVSSSSTWLSILRMFGMKQKPITHMKEEIFQNRLLGRFSTELFNFYFFYFLQQNKCCAEHAGQMEFAGSTEGTCTSLQFDKVH